MENNDAPHDIFNMATFCHCINILKEIRHDDDNNHSCRCDKISVIDRDRLSENSEQETQRRNYTLQQREYYPYTVAVLIERVMDHNASQYVRSMTLTDHNYMMQWCKYLWMLV